MELLTVIIIVAVIALMLTFVLVGLHRRNDELQRTNIELQKQLAARMDEPTRQVANDLSPLEEPLQKIQSVLATMHDQNRTLHEQNTRELMSQQERINEVSSQMTDIASNVNALLARRRRNPRKP